MSVFSCTFMQQIVGTNGVGIWVGENRERDIGLAEMLPRNLRSVDADGDGTDADGLDLTEFLLNAP